MNKAYYLLILLSFLSCTKPKTEFGQILEQSCLFLDTVQSLQFDRTFTRVSPRSGDTEIVHANVYLKYFDISRKSVNYTGSITVYDQNYTDNAIGYGRALTKDSMTFFFYQDGKMQQNTEKVGEHNFGDEQCAFLNAKNLRSQIRHREDNVDHYTIKDTLYNGALCYFIDLHLKDSPDADIKKMHESFLIRKTDYMPLCLLFCGEVAKGVVIWDRYEVADIHINEPYNEAYINTVKRDSFLNHISNLVEEHKIVESPLPFHQVPLKYADGGTTTLDKFKGKVVVLDFWYRGCFYCLKLMPELNKLSTKYRNVVFLGVDSRDATSMVIAYHTKNNFTYQTINDDKQLELKLKVSGFPTTIVLDKTGNVYSRITGFSDNAATEIEVNILEAISK